MFPKCSSTRISQKLKFTGPFAIRFSLQIQLQVCGEVLGDTRGVEIKVASGLCPFLLAGFIPSFTQEGGEDNQASI